MIRVTIYQSGRPQFYNEFDNLFAAQKYHDMWREIAVKAGVLIRVDIERGR